MKNKYNKTRKKIVNLFITNLLDVNYLETMFFFGIFAFIQIVQFDRKQSETEKGLGKNQKCLA